MDCWSIGPKSKIKSRLVAIPYTIGFEAFALELYYPFLGHRDYAHGSSMLEGMLGAVKLMEPDIVEHGAVIRQFKVISQCDSLARAEAMLTSDAAKHPFLGDAKARLDLTLNDKKITSLLFAIDKPIGWRLKEYLAGDYVEYVKWVDNDLSYGIIKRIADYIDLIRAINECNRQLTVKSFPTPEWSNCVRWAYLINMPLLTDQQCSEITKVTFARAETIDVGNHRFEVKIGQLDGPASYFEFEICFFIELPKWKEALR